MGRKIEEEEDEDVEKEETKDENGPSNMIILRKPMKDFVGLENVDEDIKKAIMNFSFYLIHTDTFLGVLYVFLTPPPLPGVFIGLVKCPGTVCARLHLKFPRVEGGDPQNGL